MEKTQAVSPQLLKAAKRYPKAQKIVHKNNPDMFDNILSENPSKLISLQIECIKQLEDIFINESVENFKFDNYSFLGVRGNYIDKENYCLHFKFDYRGFLFEFFIMYDQFEYYVEKEESVLVKCIFEDFDEKTMIFDFIKYLKKDLLKLNIAFLDKLV